MTAPTVLAILRETDAQTVATGQCLRELLGSTPWRLVCAAELAAVVADFTAEQLSPTRSNLAAWLEVLSQLGRGRAIVPMRFGQAAEDQREIERFLTCRQEHFRGVLDLVGHRVELVVRVTSPAAPDATTHGAGGAATPGTAETAPSAGRRFLLTRKQEFFAAQGGQDAELAERIVRLGLGERAVAISHEAPTATIRRGGVCVLVDRASATGAIGLIRAAAEKSHVSVHITGPLPPLGFSGGAPEAGAEVRGGDETLEPKATLTRPGEIACER